MVHIGNDWDERLAGEFDKPYYQELRQFLIEEYRHHVVYPNMHDIFNALKYTSFADTKVVILGQDPYHGPGQATDSASRCKRAWSRHRRCRTSSRSLWRTWASTGRSMGS